jgi:hypothetical protein
MFEVNEELDEFGMPLLKQGAVSNSLTPDHPVDDSTRRKQGNNYMLQCGIKYVKNEDVCGLKKTNKSHPREPILILPSARMNLSRSLEESDMSGRLPNFLFVSVSNLPAIKKAIRETLWQTSPETERLFQDWILDPSVNKIKQCGSWGKYSGLVRVRVDNSPYRLIFVAESFQDWLYLNEFRLVMDKSMQSYKDICETVEDYSFSRDVMETDKFGIPLFEDFKTSAKRFQDQGAEKSDVDQYIASFKQMKAKIKDNNQKDIDKWKNWDEFKAFVDALKGVTTKSQEKKANKESGAKLVVEDKNWKVYHITTHDAAMLYGAGTKWCITQQDSDYWDDYSSHSDFYFYISKRLGPKSPFYKIALQHDHRSDSYIFWDATDEERGTVERKFWSKERNGPIPYNLPEIPGEHIESQISKFKDKKDIIKINGEEYRISDTSNWPKVINGNLNLRETKITSLPAGLKVGGSLDLSRTPITSLPHGLQVGDDLFLNSTPITSLPDDLKVGGNLFIDGTPITSLPAGLKVGGSLDLSRTPITSLPHGLQVGGDLFLNSTPITSLPDDLKVGKNLALSYSKITSLPAGLKVGGSLNLEGLPITSLPDDLKVGGSLYLSNTPITSLPHGLKVGGNLNLNNTPITSLPAGLKVGGSLDLRKTPLAKTIKKKPEGVQGGLIK